MSLAGLTSPAAAFAVALVVALVSLAILYVRSRRSIVFDAWADFATDDDGGDRGKSLADLLLFHIRDIQNAHGRSGRELDLKNPVDDVPAFQQELDTDLKAAVELQRESRFVGPLVGLLMVLVPTRPARLRGSIHRFGDEVRVNVVLENPRSHRRVGTLQWSGHKSTSDELPALIEALAYEIYLALAHSAVFTDVVAFRRYTQALSSHLAYGSRQADADRLQAEKLYKEALELEPRNPAVLYNLGVLHYYRFRKDDNEQAEQCFREAMPAAEGALRTQVHSGLANVYCMKFHRFKSAQRTDLDIAIYHAEEALRLDDGLDVVLKAAALAHHQSSEADAALAAATDDPERARICASEAERHRELAVTYYRRTIATNPRYFTAHNNFGNLYLELARTCGDRDARRELLRASVDLFKETMKIRPSYHHAYDNLANAYYELALLDDAYLLAHAARYYRDALDLEPDYAEAKNDLAMLYLTPTWDKHDVAKAKHLHAEALASAPDEARRAHLEAKFTARTLSSQSNGMALPTADATARRAAREARRWQRRRRILARVSRIR